MLAPISRRIGERLARFLEQPIAGYASFAVTPTGLLGRSLQPCDVLLIDGDRRISVAVKYLTQSTWSHAAFYAGDALSAARWGAEPDVLIEAELSGGVIAAPLAKYRGFNTRICRPVGLTDDDRRAVTDFMVSRLGTRYDLKNIVDLARYLLPTPPVPTRWRRRMLALGSGDPTRAICSTLIAQAFQSVRYPILPKVRTEHVYETASRSRTVREVLHIRHHSLFTPRDFDVSPYFAVVKPTLEAGFDYKDLAWYEDPAEWPDADAAEAATGGGA